MMPQAEGKFRVPALAKQTAVVMVIVGLVTVVVGEWGERHRIERRYQESLRLQQQLAQQAQQLRTDRDRLAETVAAAQSRNTELTQTLDAKNLALEEVSARLTQQEHVTQEMQEKLASLQKQFDSVQGELAMAVSSRAKRSPGGAVSLEKIVVAQGSPASSAQGRVVSVDPQWRFIVFDLGWNTVKIGDIVSISRNKELLGKARVERVQEEVSAATLLPEWTNNEVKVDDTVRPL